MSDKKYASFDEITRYIKENFHLTGDNKNELKNMEKWFKVHFHNSGQGMQNPKLTSSCIFSTRSALYIPIGIKLMDFHEYSKKSL